MPRPRISQYAQLTERNRGLIAQPDQRRLRRANILVAGCGSTGGAVIEPLVRAGAEHFVLAEPGVYELNNLNRQRATRDAIGHNKADWLAAHARKVNPGVCLTVHREGITEANAAALCRNADLVFDAVDVTGLPGLRAKCALHEAASRQGRPVVAAYDLAYRQYIWVFDYRTGQPPLAGRVERVRAARTPAAALALLVPAGMLPIDLLGEVRRILRKPGASISQLGCASDLFGAIAVPLAIEILAGRRVKGEFSVDLNDVIMPASRRWWRALRRWPALLGVYLDSRRARK